MFCPQDNPLLEAQSERGAALGILDGWDRKLPVKVEDHVVLGLGVLLHDLRSGIGSGAIFPKEIGLTRVETERKRWFKLATGRAIGEAVEPGTIAEHVGEEDVDSEELSLMKVMLDMGATCRESRMTTLP